MGILSNQFINSVLSNLKYQRGEREASVPFPIVYFFVKVRLLRPHDNVGSYVGILSNQFINSVLSNLKYQRGEREASVPFPIVYFFVKVRLLRPHDNVGMR